MPYPKFFDSPFRPDEERLRKQGDMRNMRRAKCQNPRCNNEWWCGVIGKCPICKQPGAIELEAKTSGAPRV